ncbi:hypothetical protein [Sinomicrobium sp. M5D2P17]
MKQIYYGSNHFYRIYITIFAICISLSGCEEDFIPAAQEVEPQQQQEEGKAIEDITFYEFRDEELLSKTFGELERKERLAGKSNQGLYNFTVDSSRIRRVIRDGHSYYTFSVRRNTSNADAIENLVLYRDKDNNPKAFLLRYPVTGPLKKVEGHNSIVYEGAPELLPLLNTDTKKKGDTAARISQITYVLFVTYCTWGENGTHMAGPACKAAGDGRTFTVTYTYQVSIDSGSGGGIPTTWYSGSSSGGGGGSGDLDQEDGIVTAPNIDEMDMHLWDLKNFESDKLNSKERTYYHSDINIKNNIDRYLIERGFSGMSMFEAKNALNFGSILSLDYKIFNWGFNNNNKIFEETGLYLVKNDYSEESMAFALIGLITSKFGGDVDWDDRIINSLTGKAKCVYEKMKDNNGSINWILENFEDDDKPSQFNLVFEMSDTLGFETNASFATPEQSEILNTFVIKLNKDRTEEINTTLTIARTILHESIHARLWEFAYRNGKTISPEDFPGVYEYMRTYNKNWDHQQMADHYRATITKGLKQYDNAQHSDAFYNALAWEGLAEIKDRNGNNSMIYTEAWKGLSLSEQQEVLQTIANEKQNGSKTCN